LRFEVDEINRILWKKRKVFVLVGGGSGAGKNYFASMLHLPLIDVDEVNKELNDGKVNVRTTVGKALAIVKKEMQKRFENESSFVQTSTASTIKGTENKFKKAKRYGFHTVFVNIDTPVPQALVNNNNRVSAGGHGETIPKWKFAATKLGSMMCFETLKKSEYVDLAIKVKNEGINFGGFDG